MKTFWLTQSAFHLLWTHMHKVIILLAVVFIVCNAHAQTITYLQTWEAGTGEWFSKHGDSDPITLVQDATAPSPTTVQQITRQDAAGNYFSPLIHLQGGGIYCISGWIKWVGGGWPFIGIDNYDVNGQFIGENWLIGQENYQTGYGDTVTPVPTDTADWHKYSKTITLGVSTASVRMKDELWSEAVKAENNLGYFDNLKIDDGPCSCDVNSVGGSAINTGLKDVICKNVTTGQIVTIRVSRGSTSWDCNDAGLLTRTGDIVRELLLGTVQ